MTFYGGNFTYAANFGTYQHFDARVLTASHAGALRELTGDTGLPLLPSLHPALEEGQIVGDYAGQGNCRPPPRCCHSMRTTRFPPACGPPVMGPTAGARC